MKFSWIPKIIGVVGAMFGIGSAVNACSDNEADSKPVSISADDIAKCCGNDRSDAEYETCIRDYQASGFCPTSPSPEPLPMPEPAYGIIPGEIPEECCGTPSTNPSYESCINDYYANGICSGTPEPIPEPLYGMPEVDEIEQCCRWYQGDSKEDCAKLFHEYGECISDCCGLKNNSIRWERCAATGHCETVYGPPPASDEFVLDCCGPKEDSKEWTDCADIALWSGSWIDYCPKAPEPEALEACCGKDDGSTAFEHCSYLYSNHRLCDHKMVQEMDDCCGTDPNAEGYDRCTKMDTSFGLWSCYAPVEGSKVQKGVEKCCGEDDGSETWKKCKSSFLFDFTCD